MPATRLSRRTLLRGVGASLALPLLECMAARPVRAAGDVAKPPVRIAYLFMPNGVRSDRWTPGVAPLPLPGFLRAAQNHLPSPARVGSHTNFDLPPQLQPLAGVRQHVTILTNLRNAEATDGDGHFAKTAGWLTGGAIVKTTGRDIGAGGVSVDQAAAATIGDRTPLPSLELGIDPVMTGIDTNVNLTRVYGGHVSWSSPTTPVAKEILPRLAFDRLFRAGRPTPVRSGWNPDAPAVRVALAGDDASVLDLVRDDAKRLASRVGTTDRRKLEEYLDAVRAVERRIAFAAAPRPRWVNTGGPDLDNELRPAAGKPTSHAAHVGLMLDLLLLAFWTDSTRVATFMFGNAVSRKDFSFLDGVSGGHHELSHHENDPANLDQYERIATWHVAQYAGLLERMAALDEGGSSLLDNSLIAFGSGIRDGNTHQPNDLPTLLAGRGGGAVHTGRHLVSAPDTPLCNLHLSVLRAAGLPATRFGDSTGPLAGLDATPS